MAAGTIRRMDARLALAVYFLIAAAAGFVTATRTLPPLALFGVILALGAVAVLVRSRVLGIRGTTRVAVAFIVVYLVTYFAFTFLLRR
jgi:hypothetical protein